MNATRDISPCQRHLFRFRDIAVRDASSRAIRDFARIVQDAFDMFETSDNPNYRQERSRINPLDYTYRRVAAWADIPHAYICTRGSAYVIGNQEVKLTYHLRCWPACGRVLANARTCKVIFVETYIFIGILLTVLLYEEISSSFLSL